MTANQTQAQRTKNKQTNPTPKEPEPSEHARWSIPKDAIYGETGDERTYFHCAEDNVIRGALLGIETWDPGSDNGLMTHFVILTDAACEVISGKKDEPPFIVPPGTLVRLNERYQLRGLRGYTATPTVTWVGVQAIEQRAIGGGRAVWRFRWAVKDTGRRRPRALPEHASPVGQADRAPPRSDDDIPF